MENIKINLLPQEFSLKQKQLAKLRKIQGLCIAVVLLLIFLVSTILGLRIIQLREFKDVEVKAEEIENEVSLLKPKEVSLTVLKNRASLISQIRNFPARTSTSFEEILKLITGDITISSASVDRNGIILLSAIIPSPQSLGTFLDDILDDDKFEMIEIESLSAGRDDIYRINLKILQK